jgi:hypothetical protein
LDTNVLVQKLAGNAEPVRRLAPPWRRAAIWFAISTIYAVLVILNHSYAFNLWEMDTRFAIELTATLATAATAAVAAFCSVVPGYDRRWLFAPLVPLAVWFAALGESCLDEWLRLGSAGLELHSDWDCLLAAALIGIIPAIAIVAMLRRGAPLVPRASLALAGIAVAAFANFAMRLHHYGDASIIILVWHLGSVVALAFVASLLGRHVLAWRRTTSA